MGAFDDKYWNLSQAAAWVVYRRRDLVEAFEHQSDYGFASLKVYPMPDGAMAAPVGSILDLERALQAGRIKALGRRPSSPERVEVPVQEWTDLSIRPPGAVRHDRLAGRVEPWQDLLFESAELRRLWRGVDEVAGRPAEPRDPGGPGRVPGAARGPCAARQFHPQGHDQALARGRPTRLTTDRPIPG